MENKHVGLLLVGITLIFFLIVLSFNQALESIVNTSCTHGITCPMQATLKTQKIISYSLIGILFLISSFLAFFLREKPSTHTAFHSSPPIEKKEVLDEEQKKVLLESLDIEEKKVVELLLHGQGSAYQSDLIKETQLTKVKITRILDHLEGKQLIERKRRGMTNIIILK
ncbi:MarR family transcriptional regulator [Candidatus Woesearchaeota archaeon]|nr:MarR family transcriptional regulator [Candidatus Woesearchaeota archaeon]